MKPLDEIVFENRNQEYGSYVFRKRYGKYLVTSLIIAICFLSILIAYPVIASYIHRNNLSGGLENNVAVIYMPIPKDEVTPPPPPVVPVDARVPRLLRPRIVDVAEPEDEIGTQDEFSTARPIPPSTGENVIPTTEVVHQLVIETPPEQKIWIFVQEEPSLEGFNEFVVKNTRYPELAKEMGIQGVVYIGFVVEPDGSVSNVKILRGIGGGCDEEAARVVQSMPKWSPGKQDGNPVRVSLSLPVRFTLH
jgi:periplasmic protein TonB